MRSRLYSWSISEELIMKSAEALLHARGMFHSTAIRMRAWTSVSWETGVRGSKKKTRKSTSPSVILAPICWSPPKVRS